LTAVNKLYTHEVLDVEAIVEAWSEAFMTDFGMPKADNDTKGRRKWSQKTLFEIITELRSSHKELLESGKMPILNTDVQGLEKSFSSTKPGYYSWLSAMHRIIVAMPNKCFPDDTPVNPSHLHSNENWNRAYFVLRFTQAKRKHKKNENTRGPQNKPSILPAFLTEQDFGGTVVGATGGAEEEDLQDLDWITEDPSGQVEEMADDARVDEDEAYEALSTLFEYRVGVSTTVTANSARAQRPTLSAGRQKMLLKALGARVKVLYGDQQSSVIEDDNDTTNLLQMAERAAAVQADEGADQVDEKEFWRFQASLSTVSADVWGYKDACRHLGLDPVTRLLPDSLAELAFKPWQVQGKSIDCSQQISYLPVGLLQTFPGLLI
jgi:hypothetical protein